MTDATTTDRMWMKLKEEERVTRVERHEPGIIEFHKFGKLTGGMVDMVRSNGWMVREVSHRTSKGNLEVKIHRNLTYEE